MALMGEDSVSSEGKMEITRRGFIKETAAAGTVAVASNMGYRRFNYPVQPDFQQPPFYQEYFKKWGLDAPKNSK